MSPRLDRDRPDAYLAEDRRQALAEGAELPDRARGSALFADISGFTPLTEALVETYGPRRGADEIAEVLDRVFGELLTEVHREGGSVVYFSGDAITCWFEQDDGGQAVRSGLAMQRKLESLATIAIGSAEVRLELKVAVVVGQARRFVVGDPRIQLIDVLAGRLMDRLAAAEGAARAGEVVAELDQPLAGCVSTERVHAGRRYVVVDRFTGAEQQPDEAAGPPSLPESVSRAWLLPAVYERMVAGRGEFLTELRTAVPLFLRFGGLDFDDDPASGRRLNDFVVAAQRIVDDFGGSTLQLTLGDKGAYLYAVFGTPRAHEDDAARACSATLELLGLAEVHPVTDLQIGLALGRVRSGTYGHPERRTFCCLGDPVNLAARLMGAAAPGTAAVSAAARSAAGPGFAWRRLDDLRLKGKAAAVEAYALGRSDHAAAPSSRARRDHEGALVGRRRELAELHRLRAQTLAGRGAVVAVRGVAGMGKSRLVAELRRGVESGASIVHAGEAEPFGTRTAYAAWRPIWSGLLGVPTGSDGHDVDRIATVAPELVPRAPLLGPVLGIDVPDNDLTSSLSPKLRKASTESLLVALFARLTQAQPTMIIIEDAQWLDPLSVDLLAELARGIPDLPVLLLVLARPAEPGEPDPLAALDDVTAVDLDELDGDETRELIMAAVARQGGSTRLAAEAVRLVVERCDGNPYAIEEMVAALLAQEVDLSDTRALSRLDLPDSLQALALARLDQLGEGPRRVAKVASVIGRRFPARMVGAVYPELGSEEEIAVDLSTLRGADVVITDPVADDDHRFRQMIVAQAAYDSIPAGLLGALHGAAGRWLEAEREGRTGAALDLLAHHFGRSDDLARKRDYLVRAGDQARLSYANSAAADYYDQALVVLEDADAVPVMISRGSVLELTGDWSGAERSYRQALDLAVRIEDSLAVARARTALAEVARKQGRYAEATTLLADARQSFELAEDRVGLGEVLHLSGTLAAQQGQYATAREHYRASLALRQAGGEIDKAAALLSNLGVVAEYEGDLDQAVELNQQALALRRELGDRWAIGVSENNLGMIALLRSEPVAAAERFTEALRLNTEVGDTWMVAIAHNNLGNAYRASARFADAGMELALALEGYRRQSDRWALAILYEDIAALAVRREAHEQAIMLVGAAESLRAEIGSPLSPTQQDELDSTLTPARAAVGDRATDLMARGRTLDDAAVVELARAACG